MAQLSSGGATFLQRFRPYGTRLICDFVVSYKGSAPVGLDYSSIAAKRWESNNMRKRILGLIVAPEELNLCSNDIARCS